MKGLTATFRGNNLDHLYDKVLDKCKACALKKSKGNFESRVTLSKDAVLSFKWWRDNIVTVSKNLR